MKTKNTNPIVESFFRTTIRMNGMKINNLKILKRKLSMIFSYDHASLFIFLTSAPEKLLVKKVNECL